MAFTFSSWELQSTAAPPPPPPSAPDGWGPRNKVFVVCGPPSSGKGTQCKLLAERFGMAHMSTGDIFRSHVDRGTERKVPQGSVYILNLSLTE